MKKKEKSYHPKSLWMIAFYVEIIGVGKWCQWLRRFEYFVRFRTPTGLGGMIRFVPPCHDLLDFLHDSCIYFIFIEIIFTHAEDFYDMIIRIE